MNSLNPTAYYNRYKQKFSERAKARRNQKALAKEQGPLIEI
jgi:hypothetical protein